MTYQIACHFHNPEYMLMIQSLTFANADVKLINDCLNYDLSHVYTWLSANKLTLNLTKT